MNKKRGRKVVFTKPVRLNIILEENQLLKIPKPRSDYVRAWIELGLSLMVEVEKRK